MRTYQRAAIQRIYNEQIQPKTAYQDLGWFLLRFTHLECFPHSERDKQGISSTRSPLISERHQLQAYGMYPQTAPETDGCKPVYSISRLLYKPEGRGAEKQPFTGPAVLSKTMDTPLNRAIIYVNMLAYLQGATAKHQPKLYLMLPQQLHLLSDRLIGKVKNLPAEQQGSTLVQVKYVPKMCEQILAFAAANPTFGIDKPGYIHRKVDYDG